MDISQTTDATAIQAPERVPYTLWQLVRYFFRLGTLGFGGPGAALVSDGLFVLSMQRSGCLQSVFSRRSISKSHVRAALVIICPPGLDHRPSLGNRPEPMQVQAFIPQLSVEALAVAVLPRASAFDVKCSRPELTQPLAQLLRQKFWTIVRPNVLRNSSPQHHVRQCFDYLQAS